MNRRTLLVGLALSLLGSGLASLAEATPFAARWIVEKKKIETLVTLESDALVLRSRAGDVLRSIPYTSVRTAAHARTRHRRWAAGAVLGAVAPLGYAAALTKSTRYQVTLFGRDAATVLELDGAAYGRLLPEIDARLSSPSVETTR